MMIVANFCSTIGFYGFANWVPTLLIAKGIHVTQSLQYTFIMAFAYPLFALVGTTVRRSDGAQMAGRHLRRIGMAVCGVAFSMQSAPAALIVLGFIQTMMNTWISFSFHNYQAELFPTRMRARAVGLRLFLEPVQHDLHRLLRRVLPEELRRARRVRLHRGGHGDRGNRDRCIRSAHQSPAAGGDLALTYRAGAWYQRSAAQAPTRPLPRMATRFAAHPSHDAPPSIG